jgi:hypothetical protein
MNSIVAASALTVSGLLVFWGGFKAGVVQSSPADNPSQNLATTAKCPVTTESSHPFSEFVSSSDRIGYRDKDFSSEAAHAETTPDSQGVQPSQPETSAKDLIEGKLAEIIDHPKAQNSAYGSPLAAWHKNFVNDSTDPTWSPIAQTQIESTLTSLDDSNIEVISVKCGQAVCEIQAASTDADNKSEAANSWIANLASMQQEPWWHTYGLDAPSSAMWSSADGRALIVSYVTRSAPAN